MAICTSENVRLMRECVCAFHQVSGLGCSLSIATGDILYDTGYSVERCELCAKQHISKDICTAARSQAWHEAERFGGRYIYNCPKGLTCIATPVQTDRDTIGYVTAGPFLMVEREEFLQCEMALCSAEEDRTQHVIQTLAQVPHVPAEQAEPMAKQLFLSVGGMGKALRIDTVPEQQETIHVRGETCDPGTGKRVVRDEAYPLQMEKEFLKAVSISNKALAESLLNQLLGHIFFLNGGDLEYMRARLCELLVLSARAAVNGGADERDISAFEQKCMEEMLAIRDGEKLCFWLTPVLKEMIDHLFSKNATERRNVMPCALSYIRINLGSRISLGEVAREVHLSPSYFSRLFREETGRSFSEYIQAERIEQAKRYLRRRDCSITEIATQTGFFDQSHFTKAFKHATGTTPGKYLGRSIRGCDEPQMRQGMDEQARMNDSYHHKWESTGGRP
jgi:AraC-like DNA-binding protein/ligand-binding sensor protein